MRNFIIASLVLFLLYSNSSFRSNTIKALQSITDFIKELPKGLSEKVLLSINKKEEALSTMRKMMLDASKNLQFENAAKLRDQIKEIESDLERIPT